MKKMKLQHQILLVNFSILAGLVFEFFKGSSIYAIVIAGILLFLVANVTFYIRLKKVNKQ